MKFFSHLDCFLVFGDETFSMEPIWGIFSVNALL